MEGDAARLMELFKTAPPQRDDLWKDRFNAAFWPTRLGSFTPHVMQNDLHGFYSYRLGRDEFDGGQAPTEAASLVDYAIEKGIGLILWPSTEPQPFWAFSLGDVISYRLYGTAFARPFWNDPPETPGEQVIQEPEQIMIGSPNDEMFPSLVRGAVQRFMKDGLGIREPKMALVQRPSRGARLVFQLPVNLLGGPERTLHAFNAVAWHVPSCIPLYHMPSLEGSHEMKAF